MISHEQRIIAGLRKTVMDQQIFTVKELKKYSVVADKVRMLESMLKQAAIVHRDKVLGLNKIIDSLVKASHSLKDGKCWCLADTDNPQEWQKHSEKCCTISRAIPHRVAPG